MKKKSVDVNLQEINEAEEKKSKSKENHWRPMTFFLRVLYAVIFCLVLFIAQKGAFGEEARQFTDKGLHYVFEQQFNFVKAKNWVEDVFGSASLAFFLPNEKPAIEKVTEEASARVITRFSETQTGVQIESYANASVHADVEGIVIFAGRKPETGQTLIIQAEDGMEYWYGQLEELKLQVYHSVVKDEIIGIAGENNEGESSQYYFALKKNGKFIDPKQVLPLES